MVGLMARLDSLPELLSSNIWMRFLNHIPSPNAMKRAPNISSDKPHIITYRQSLAHIIQRVLPSPDLFASEIYTNFAFNVLPWEIIYTEIMEPELHELDKLDLRLIHSGIQWYTPAIIDPIAQAFIGEPSAEAIAWIANDDPSKYVKPRLESHISNKSVIQEVNTLRWDVAALCYAIAGMPAVGWNHHQLKTPYTFSKDITPAQLMLRISTAGRKKLNTLRSIHPDGFTKNTMPYNEELHLYLNKEEKAYRRQQHIDHIDPHSLGGQSSILYA